MNAPEVPREPLGSAALRIPCEAEWVSVARLAAAAVSNRLPFSIEDSEDIKLAIAEACTLFIQSSPRPRDIEIVFAVSDRELVVTIHGSGSSTVTEPAPPSESNRAEGLGMFLVRSLMDRVDQESDPRFGAAIVMTKRIGSS